MDNQQSYDLRGTAKILKLKMKFIAPEVKRPNRAERANRTAKNHIIATCAGQMFPSRLFTCLLGQMFTTNSDNIESYPSFRIQRFYLSISRRPRKTIKLQSSPNSTTWMQSISLEFTRQSRILVGPRHRSNIHRTCLGSLQSFQRLDSHQLGI
jgi:hypothetical protein